MPWVTEHAGRLTEFVIAFLISEIGTGETEMELQPLGEKRVALTRSAIERFRQENPSSSRAGKHLPVNPTPRKVSSSIGGMRFEARIIIGVNYARTSKEVAGGFRTSIETVCLG